MEFENNIKILQNTHIGKNLISVDKNDELAKVNFLGKVIRWVKHIYISDKAYEDCKITKVAYVLEKMVKSNQLNNDELAIVQDKFSEMLDKKTLKPLNRGVIQVICRNLFPNMDIYDSAEKEQITKLTDKVLTEGFGTLKTGIDVPPSAVVEQLASVDKLDTTITTQKDEKAPPFVIPLLHSAILSLNPQLSLNIVRLMVDKGADLNSFTINGKKAVHAYVWADVKKNEPLKKYIEDQLQLTDTQKEELFRKAKGKE